jgi:hypothetical protein
MVLMMELERRQIYTEIMSVNHNIGIRQREIEQLRQTRLRLESRLIDLQRLEDEVSRCREQELIRLCNTPCWRYLAGMSYGEKRSV